MKDIRILEEAMERAKDDEGKLALMDLIADNLTEFSVLVAVPGKEDLPIPGLPLFTREKFMEELPETKVQRMTLQEAFEEAICLPGCEGVVLNITNQPAPGMSIGGDRFGNYEGQLPKAKGRRWTECDINTLGARSRGAERIIFSNDGLIYYTSTHYQKFERLY